MELNTITTIIEHLNFNERLPENHSFCSTNLNGDYATIYNNKIGTIEKDRKKYLFDKILTNSVNKIELLYKHFKTKLSLKKQEEIEFKIKNANDLKNAFFCTKLKKDIFKEINTLSYNKKDIVLKSWNDKTNNLQLLDENEIDNQKDIEFTDSEENHNNINSESDSEIDSEN